MGTNFKNQKRDTGPKTKHVPSQTMTNTNTISHQQTHRHGQRPCNTYNPHIHTNAHKYEHTDIHSCIHHCIYSNMYTCNHTCIHICIHTYMHTCIRTYAHAYMGLGHVYLCAMCVALATSGQMAIGLDSEYVNRSKLIFWMQKYPA